MNRYMITITVPSTGGTFSNVTLDLNPNGANVSYPKESGIEITKLNQGPLYEFSLSLPHINEELRFSFEPRSMNEVSPGILTRTRSWNSKEAYLS